MSETVSIKQLRENYGALLDRVQRDELYEVRVTRSGRPWVVLRSPKSYESNQLEVMRKHPSSKARENLADLLGKVHYQKRLVLIMRNRLPVACICPAGGE